MTANFPSPNLIHNKPLNQLAKSALPFVSRMAGWTPVSRFFKYAELGASLVLGKGSGSGWDMDSEIAVATSLITSRTPVLLDVGANWGLWSTGMLRNFPACSKLLMVEPQAKCLESLEKLDFAQKSIFPCAVSDRAGTMDFYGTSDAEPWEAASFFERTETYFSSVPQKKFSVVVRTLDEIIDECQVSQIDFMKLDIEGAELFALKGVENNLRRRRIQALSFEFGSGNINSRTFFRDFWGFLNGCGFEIMRILPGGRTLKVHAYNEDLEHFRGVTNYVARLTRFP
jgi:FkbM family methyltransferase